MSVEIPVRRVSLDKIVDHELAKGYILEFIVVDAFTVHAVLLTDKDPTLVSTDYITIASEDFHREGEVDEATGELVEGSLEDYADFAVRSAKEAAAWALEEVVEHKEATKLVSALASVLPPAYDR